MYRKIMVPLDGSELAEYVLPHAINIVEKEGAKLELVIVVELFEMPVHGGVVIDEDAVKQIQHQQSLVAEDYVKRIEESLKSRNIDVTSAVLSGKVADSLIDYAANNDIDLIIMGTHGRSGVSRWIWGSIADKVLHSSTVPVLLVHPAIKK